MQSKQAYAHQIAHGRTRPRASAACYIQVMLMHPLCLLTTHLMWKSVLIFLLTLGIAATPRSGDDGLCKTLRSKQKKVRLPGDCDSEVFYRTKHKLCCYQESDLPSYSKHSLYLNCTDVRNLKTFSVIDVQYVVVTDKGRGVVTVITWNDDARAFETVQTLQVDNAHSADVVNYRGQIFLFIAVFDNEYECGQCENDPLSPVHVWNLTAGMFNESPLHYLPSSFYVNWFYERYNGQNTFIVVLGPCSCPTHVYYWNQGLERLMRIDQPDLENTLPNSDTTVQSVRDQRTQYILLAKLDRATEYNPVRVFRWSTGSGMVPHGKLDTHVQEREGMSVIQDKGQVFLCTVSRGSQRQGRIKAMIYKLNFGRENESHKMTEVGFKEKENQQPSSCNLFVDSRDGELYAAVGYYACNTRLFRYSPVTDRFREAGELASDTSAKDLVTLHSRDDFFIVTARGTEGNGKCAIYADDNL